MIARTKPSPAPAAAIQPEAQPAGLSIYMLGRWISDLTRRADALERQMDGTRSAEQLARQAAWDLIDEELAAATDLALRLPAATLQDLALQAALAFPVVEGMADDSTFRSDDRRRLEQIARVLAGAAALLAGRADVGRDMGWPTIMQRLFSATGVH